MTNLLAIIRYLQQVSVKPEEDIIERIIDLTDLVSTDMLHFGVAIYTVVSAVGASVPPLSALVPVLIGVACTLGGLRFNIIAPNVILATAVSDMVQISQRAVGLN